MSRAWVKIYRSILDSQTVAYLSPGAFRLWVLMIVFAGEVDDNGRTATTERLSWRLRFPLEETIRYLRELSGAGFVQLEGEAWYVTNWNQWQPATTSTERSRKSRRLQRNVAATLQQRVEKILISSPIKPEEEELLIEAIIQGADMTQIRTFEQLPEEKRRQIEQVMVLVQAWREETLCHIPYDVQARKDHFINPAYDILELCSWDIALAQRLMLVEKDRMRQAGYPPSKISAVLPRVKAQLDNLRDAQRDSEAISQGADTMAAFESLLGASHE